MPSDVERDATRRIYDAHPLRDYGRAIPWDELPETAPIKLRLTAVVAKAIAAARAEAFEEAARVAEQPGYEIASTPRLIGNAIAKRLRALSRTARSSQGCET